MTTLRARLFCAAVAMCLLSSSSWAQDGLRSASLPERNLRSPDPSAPIDRFRAGPRTYAPPDAPRFPRDRRHRRFPHGFGFFPYGSFVEPWSPYGPPLEVPVEEQVNGYLQLQVVPGAAEVLVDGFYVGSVDDIRRMGTGYSLEPGPHRIELRASGFQTVTFDVRIVPGETIVYRKDLEANPRPASPPPAPGVPKTFYVIPGCYAGDKPPRTVQLPPACDAAKARTIPPQVSAARLTGKGPLPGRQ